MGLTNGDGDGFSWPNIEVQIVSREDAEIRLSYTYDTGIFFNNDRVVSDRPPDC